MAPPVQRPWTGNPLYTEASPTTLSGFFLPVIQAPKQLLTLFLSPPLRHLIHSPLKGNLKVIGTPSAFHMNPV